MEKLSDIVKNSDYLLELAPDWQKRGYVSISNSVIYKKGLSIGAKAFYWYLLSRCFGDKTNCFMSIHRVCFDLEISNKTVIKYKKELVKNNLLKVKRRGWGKTNIYILKF